MGAQPEAETDEQPYAPRGARAIKFDRSPRDKPAASRIGVVLGAFEPMFTAGLAAAVSSAESFDLLASEVEDDALPGVIEELMPAVAVVDERIAFDEQRARALVHAHPETSMVVLASPPARAHVVQLIGEGVTCLNRSERGDGLLTAMSRAASADPPQPGAEFRVSITRVAAIRGLTVRERQVLAHLEEGRSPAEIARSLVISVATVRRHRSAICRKLRIRDRQDLLAVVDR